MSEDIYIPEWNEDPYYLRYEPDHAHGNGRYYKKPNTADDTYGFFTFAPAVYDARFYEEPREQEYAENIIHARCDSGAPREMPMPTDLHKADDNGVCIVCGSTDPIFGTTRSHVASLSNMKILRIPMQTSKGFVIYIELHSQELEQQAFVLPQNTARTLQELFKLMLEWEWAYTELGSRDIHAVLAYELLGALGLPSELREWLWTEVPEMRVAKYLKGDINARERANPEDIPDMTLDFDAWCWHNIQRTPTLWIYGPR